MSLLSRKGPDRTEQLRSLTVGHLGRLLNESSDGVDLNKAKEGYVIYFRLQSLLSPKAVGTLGRLIINHLNFFAGTAHREDGDAQLVPIYLDEFASFACLEFADLISKARSAGYTGTHCLRHGMATLARKVGGMGLDSVIAMTGHKDLKLADHYSKIDSEVQKSTSLNILNHINKLIVGEENQVQKTDMENQRLSEKKSVLPSNVTYLRRVK